MSRYGSAAIAFASVYSWKTSSRAEPPVCLGMSALHRLPTADTRRFAQYRHAQRCGCCRSGRRLSTAGSGSTGTTRRTHYKDDRDYVFAIAEALREEYLEIINAGLILQIDDAVLANMAMSSCSTASAIPAVGRAARGGTELTRCAGFPEDRIRYHVCFGSWHVPHMADAPLDAIAPLILKVRAGAYAIEAANVRHEHEWRLWQTTKLPAGKILIPGVVTHHTTTVEHPRLVADGSCSSRNW